MNKETQNFILNTLTHTGNNQVMWTQLGKMSTGKQNQTSWAGNYTVTSVYPSKHCTTVPVSTTVCTIYQTEREEGAATCQDCIFWQDCILTGNVRCTLLKYYI